MCALVCVKDLASLADLEDLPVGVGLGGIYGGLGGLGEEDAFASACWHLDCGELVRRRIDAQKNKLL